MNFTCEFLAKSVTSLTIFLHTVFQCTQSNSVILLYENSTRDIATKVLDIELPNHLIWLTINIDNLPITDTSIEASNDNYINPLS